MSHNGGTASSEPLTTPAPASTSSAINMPSKLTCYLNYAERVLGIMNAAIYEPSLSCEGYGPDILSFIDEKNLILCGLCAGDAIRLKQGASAWWNSPEAKRSKISVPEDAHSNDDEPQLDYKKIRFEKRFVDDGGCVTVFGAGLVEGVNCRYQEFTLWYYNEVMKHLEKVPSGYVPIVDPESLDLNEPPYESPFSSQT
jgi:hypothetical protein